MKTAVQNMKSALMSQRVSRVGGLDWPRRRAMTTSNGTEDDEDRHACPYGSSEKNITQTIERGEDLFSREGPDK